MIRSQDNKKWIQEEFIFTIWSHFDSKRARKTRDKRALWLETYSKRLFLTVWVTKQTQSTCLWYHRLWLTSSFEQHVAPSEGYFIAVVALSFCSLIHIFIKVNSEPAWESQRLTLVNIQRDIFIGWLHQGSFEAFIYDIIQEDLYSSQCDQSFNSPGLQRFWLK